MPFLIPLSFAIFCVILKFHASPAELLDPPPSQVRHSLQSYSASLVILSLNN